MSDWELVPEQSQDEWVLHEPEQSSTRLTEAYSAKDEGAGNAFLSAFNRPFERLTYGALSYLPGKVGQAAGDHNQYGKSEEEYAHQTHPWAAGAGEILGSTIRDLPAFSLGAGAASKAFEAIPALKRAGQVYESAKLAGETAPMGARVANYGKSITEMAGGGATTALQDAFINGKSAADEVAHGAKVGGAVGAIFPAIGATLGLFGKMASIPLKAAGRKINEAFLNPEQAKKVLSEELLQGLNPAERAKALANKEAGAEAGINLSPAEASGNPLLAKTEAKLPANTEQEMQVHRHKEAQKVAQKAAVDEFLDGISESSSNAPEELRKAIDAMIKGKKETRGKEAGPLYAESRKNEVPFEQMKSLLENDVVREAFKDVTAKSTFREELKGKPVNSIEYVDMVKKRLDDKIDTAMRTGETYEAGLLQKAQKALLDAADQASPKYKEARDAFKGLSPEINKLEKGLAGKIAKLPEDQYEKVTGMLFGRHVPAKEIKALREKLVEHDSENAEKWDSLVRYYLEGKIDTARAAKSGAHGSTFFDNVANTEKEMNRLQASLSGKPEAQKKLTALKTVFKDLVNSRTVKGSAGKSDTNMFDKRNALDSALAYMDNMINAKHRQKLLNLIETGEWDSAFSNISLKGTPEEQLKSFNNFLDSISKKLDEKLPEQVGKRKAQYAFESVKNEREKKKEPITLVVPYTEQGKTK